MTDENRKMTKNAFDLWKSELPGRSRSALKKELDSCVKNRSADKLKALLAAVELSTDNGQGLFGSPPDGTLHPDYLNYALCTAAEKGHTEIARILAGAGADIHFEGNRPLRSAAYASHGDTMMALIRLGADVDNALANVGDSSATRRALNIFKSLQSNTHEASEGQPAPTTVPMDGADGGWKAMGETCIAYSEGAESGPSLTMVFNFRAKEVTTLVTAPGHNAPVTPAIRSFAEFDNAALVREAEEKLVAARGGKPLKFRM